MFKLCNNTYIKLDNIVSVKFLSAWKEPAYGTVVILFGGSSGFHEEAYGGIEKETFNSLIEQL